MIVTALLLTVLFGLVASGLILFHEKLPWGKPDPSKHSKQKHYASDYGVEPVISCKKCGCTSPEGKCSNVRPTFPKDCSFEVRKQSPKDPGSLYCKTHGYYSFNSITCGATDVNISALQQDYFHSKYVKIP